MQYAFDQRPDEIKTHCRLVKDQEALILTPGNWARANGVEEMVLAASNQDRMMAASACGGPRGPSFRVAGGIFIFSR